MYIEDLIDQLVSSNIQQNVFDSKITGSFFVQILNGTGFTEKQSLLAVKILSRYSEKLSIHLSKDVAPSLENPTFRYTVRKSVTTRTIDVVDKSIVVKFPYDENFVMAIREHKKKNMLSEDITWDREQTAWIFQLNERNIQFLTDFCSPSVFQYDDSFALYADECEEILNNLENYSPMLAIDDGELKILNSPKNMPKIDTDNIMEALFQARKLGVTLWDDNIEQYLVHSEHIDSKLRDFLKTTDKPIQLSAEKTDISTLKTILQYLGPTLFVVPGGSELVKLTQAVDILNASGVANKNMAVLFRLPTETGRNFNDFVKNQGLNGPISEETKVVFVSGKLPKPLIKSGIHFNCIVNLGFDSAHYTMKEYVKNHPNLVYFDLRKNNRGNNFAFM